MKKIIFIVLTFIVMLFVYINVNAEVVVISDSAIRFRVIANSNSLEDQNMKMVVKEYIDDYLGTRLVDINDLNSARNIIENEIDNINEGIEKLFLENDYDKKFVIYYGDNFFPKKLYKGVSYKNGIYESLVITIGDGNGDNWWCVLFPPLCLLDVEENEMDDVEYQFFIKNLIDRIFE